MTMVTDSIDVPRVRKFTRDEYYQMAQIGMFDGQRVELIHGEIITMSPQANPHARALLMITRIFMRALGDDFSVRPQLPLSVTNDSEPEPDIAIVHEAPHKLSKGHPSTAQLVIEVSDSSLANDRLKASIYARARVPEYWIVNLKDQVIEVHSQPSSKAGKYLRRRILKKGDRIQPVTLSIDPVAVVDCFPIT